jgi:hypothetical protein
MRRKVLARCVRSVVESLEGRTLLSSTLAANAGTATISGVVYNDANGNGVQDAGEPAVAGLAVSLSQVGVTYAPGTVPTVLTDGNGAFSFTTLAAGQYDVAIVPDTGFVQDAPGVFSVSVAANISDSVAIGETTNALAGGSGVAKLTGTVFNDVNQDGVYTPVIEDFLAGDTVYVDLDGSGTLTATDPTATTNNTGQYTFIDVPPGSYLIRVVPRPGFHQDPPGYSDVTIYSGQTINTNLGENNRATISGVVFQDLNGDGVQQAGELPVGGETVFLDDNLDGTLEAGVQNPSTGLWDADPQTGGTEQFATTDSTGHYELTGLTPGEYRVVIQTAAGLVQATPGYVDVTLAQGQDLNLNLAEAAGSSVSGTVYDDRNANGTLDVGEPGLPNQVVYLDINNNGVFDQTGLGADGLPQTSASTTYSLPATAVVSIDGQTGVQGALTGSQTIAYTIADLNVGDNANLTIEPGTTTITSIQATDTPIASPQNNPALGIGPSGTITAVDPFNNTVTIQPAELSAVTDANGNYTFSNLGPGTYTMRFVTPPGGTLTGPATGTHDYTFTLGNNSAITGDNFGFQTPDLTATIINFPTKPSLTNVPKHAMVRITNVGSLPVNGLAGINLWAQTTSGPVDTTTAFLIAAFKGRSVHLPVGHSRVFNINFEYPTQLPLNSYYITAQVVSNVHDNDLANDFSPVVGPVKVGPPYIDLGLAYASQPATVVDPGQGTAIDLTLTNTGNVTNKGNVSFRIYLSQGPVIEPTDMVIETISAGNLHIAPGKSRNVVLSLPFPSQNLGSQFINVAVDSGDPLGETDLLNNVAIAPTPTRFD